jgi:hypothetical protein
MIGRQVAHLRDEAERLRAEFENDQVARLLEPQAVLHDPEALSRFLRYQSDYRTTFHRAYNALIKTIERDNAALAEGIDPADLDGCAGDPGVDSAPADPQGRDDVEGVEAEAGTRNGSPAAGPEGAGTAGEKGVEIETRNEPTSAPGGVSESVEVTAVTERTSDSGCELPAPRCEAPRRPPAAGSREGPATRFPDDPIPARAARGGPEPPDPDPG